VAKLNMLFEVPKWVEMGLRSGSFKISGGVVRDNAGKIVHILQEGTKIAPQLRGPLILAGLAAVAVAGIGYYLYSRSKKRTSESPTIDPDAFEQAIRIYCENVKKQRVSLDEIRQLSSELQRFINLMESPDFQDAEISIDNTDALEKLRDFHHFLRTFNLKLREEKQTTKEVPPALATYDTLVMGRDGVISAYLASSHTLDLTRQLREQLRFQEEVWSVYLKSSKGLPR